MENKYYNAKQMKADSPEDAIDEFLSVPGLEPEKGDWGFKGLKQAIKLEFKLGRYEKVNSLLRQVRQSAMLTSNSASSTTRNYSHTSSLP